MKKAILALAVLSLGIAVSAQAPTQGTIAVSPRNVYAGEAQVGEWSVSEDYFTVKNIGQDAVAVNIVSNNPQFVVQNSNCGLLHD